MTLNMKSQSGEVHNMKCPRVSLYVPLLVQVRLNYEYEYTVGHLIILHSKLYDLMLRD